MVTITHTAKPASWKYAFERCKTWLQAGIADFKKRPLIGLLSGIAFFSISYLTIAGLYLLDMSWMLVSVFSGMTLVAPLLAIGLYRAARQIKEGRTRPIASRGQLVVAGSVLLLLLITWVRAAAILYAVFFGLTPVPALGETLHILAQTPTGLILTLVGISVGGLFAAFTLAVAAFSIPMLVDRKVDAFTAMGKSFSACAHNFKLATAWGILTTGIMMAGLATGFIATIVLFPLVGFATWHAYDDLFGASES